MKRIVIALYFVSFISCSPKLRSSIITTLPELPATDLVVVLEIIDDQIINEAKLGEIKAVDNGMSNNCSYYENIQNLKVLARKAGANLIKISKHKRADKWSSCDRLWATIYKVENVKTYETEIEWTPDRKLTWDDFKGQPNNTDFPDALAVTNSGITFESGSFNPFKVGGVFVRNMFINHGSWVLPEGRNDYVLRHEQIHFDITEIYTRKLRKAFSDANITANNTSRAQAIFETIKNEWEKRQNYYDTQTKHGLKAETQKEWEAIIILELANYDLYKVY